MAGFTPSGWGGGGGGMPPDMAAAAAQNMALKQAQLATQNFTASSEAALRGAQTREVAPNAQSARDLQAAQGKLAGAQASNVGMETFTNGLKSLFMPQQMYDQSRLTNAQAGQADATARRTNFFTDYDKVGTGVNDQDVMKYKAAPGAPSTATAPSATAPSTNVTNNVMAAPAAPTVVAPSWTNPAATAYQGADFGGPTLSPLPSSRLVKPFNLLGGDITANTSPMLSTDDGSTKKYARGTARVPGKGLPTKDTVKAKLAPGEAVLNNAAAEMMGRHNIAALNAHGAMAMGMPPASGKGNKHKAGTSGIPSLDALYAEKSPMVSLGAPIAAAGRVSVGAP